MAIWEAEKSGYPYASINGKSSRLQAKSPWVQGSKVQGFSNSECGMRNAEIKSLVSDSWFLVTCGTS